MPTEPTAAAEEAWSETLRILQIANRAADKLWTMYQRSEVSPSAELDWFLNERETMRALRKKLAASPPPSDADAHRRLVHTIEQVLFDRILKRRMDGYTVEAADEIGDLILAARLQAAPPARKS